MQKMSANFDRHKEGRNAIEAGRCGKWFMESCLDTGLFGVKTMLYHQWY